MSSPNPAVTCPTCGATLLADAFQGLCVVCAWNNPIEPEELPAAPAGSGEPLFRVPGHEVLGEIARGGAGVVYRARQLKPQREVALKMLLPHQLGSDEMIARFRIEAETVAALEHPSILPVYLADVHCGIPFFTMKLAAGGTLTARQPSLTGRWRDIAALVATLADAVHFAHSRGVIHRDLKPGNILFDEVDRPYVSDFGLAKFTGADVARTRTLNLLGTPAYLAPETVEHGAQAATIASDVYGLGGILYELLAGRPPFSAESLPALLKAIAEDSPEAPSRHVRGAPRDLEIVCARCLAKDPAQRFASAVELSAELRRWLEGRPIVSRPVSASERVWQWCRRRPALSALAALLALTLILAGTALWRANRSLTRALADARAAEAESQRKLQASLLSEGKLRSNSGTSGQRLEALDLLDRAARIAPSVDVRGEIASALTRPDLRLVRELPGTFPERTTLLEFSPELETYAMPSDGGFVLRSAADGRVLRNYPSPRGVVPRQFRFSGNGNILGVVFADRSTSFWSVDAEAPQWTLPPDQGTAVPFALHPTRPVVAYRSTTGEVRLHDLTTGSERHLIPTAAPLTALTFDPTGRTIAVVRDSSVDRYNVESGALLWSRPDMPLGMPPVWSTEGRLLVTANRSRHGISIRDSATGVVQQTLAGHTAFPVAAAFLPDGKRIVTLAFDGTLRLWDLASGAELLQAPFAARGLTLSADGRTLGAAGKSDRPGIFAWAEETAFREMQGWPRLDSVHVGFLLAGSGEWLATAGWESLRRNEPSGAPIQVTLWDTHREKAAASFAFRAHRDDRVTMAVDTTSRTIVYSMSSGGIWRRQVNRDASGNITLGPEIGVDPSRTAFLLRIETEGDWVVVRVRDRSLALWPQGDVGRETALQFGHPDPGLLHQIDRHHVITRDPADGDLRLWSRSGGSALGKLATRPPAYAAFAPDGSALVVGTGESYRAWTLPALQSGPEWTVRSDISPWHRFGFSPSARWFAGASGGSAIEIRDGRTFALITHLEPPLALEMTGLLWSPDETRIYLSFRGPRVFIWDLPALRRELARRGLDW